MEHASFSLVNVERQSDKAQQLGRDNQVARLAREYSERMRDEGFFSHTAPDGMNLRKRLVAAGVNFKGAAENLVKVANSADPAGSAHTLLLLQPQHRENMLNHRYELLGVGVAKRGDSVWITQIYLER